jgi:heme/copper-type cytochrome/quinol oxidase subunit 2
MEKRIFFAAAVALLIFFSGCVQTQLESGGGKSAEVAPKGELREIEMTAKRYEFNPDTITVNKGDTVRITLTSLDVTHGIKLNEFGINMKALPGQPEVIEFVADKAGTFTFKPSVYSGLGSADMKGTLIVEENGS